VSAHGRFLYAAVGLLLAGSGASVLSGCSSGTKTSSSGEVSPQAIEREERTEAAGAVKGEESQEVQKERELLSVLESKKREEAAEVKARHTVAAANAKAKRREAAAEKAVKRKEKEASEAAAKKRASEKSKTKATTKPPTVKKKTTTRPKESVAPPPTVSVPSGGN
jgi:hypothetical protein